MSHQANSSCSSFEDGTPDISSFAYNLFASLVTTSSNEYNVLISPFSIAAALALVLAGATIDSLCQKEIASTLGINSHSDIPMLSKMLLSSSSSKTSGVELSVANGIWTKVGEDGNDVIKTSYKDTVDKVHGAIANTLPETYDPINEYVSEKTGGLIKDLMKGDVDSLTKAVLVNAVFFKGSWNEKFDEGKTYKGTFHTLKGNNKIVDREAMMMKSTRVTHFGMEIKSLNGAHCALLEYENNGSEEFGALFLLPNKNDQRSMQYLISDLVKLITKGNAGSDKTQDSTPPLVKVIQNELQREKVALTIPRFKISYGVKSLKSDLQRLGIKEAFDRNGNGLFNEMTTDPLVYLDEVYHKAVMEVTEEGTVAAAATAAVMMTRSIPRPPPELVFDRPFLMIVFHFETGLPLFMSKVDDPEFEF